MLKRRNPESDQAPDVAKRFEGGGGRVLRMSAAKPMLVKSEIKKWSTLIRAA